MIKTIVIDDEPLARFVVREHLQRHPQFDIVQECGDGFDGLKAIQQQQPQLLFLDVQLPKINGFEMLELLEVPPTVIFTTAYDEYALKAFEANAIDYLLKPFAAERFDKALQKFLQQDQSKTATVFQNPILPEQLQRIVVKTNGKIKIIPIADIHYLEAADDYVKIYTADGHFLKNKTLAYFEQWLDAKQFVRVHRSYMVHVSQISRLEPYVKESYMAVLKSLAQVPVSKNGYQKLKLVLGI